MTFFTRADGEVKGALQNQIPLPPNTASVVRSTGVMVNQTMTQSGFWVGPRLFMSTLHFHSWIGKYASFNECEEFRQIGVAFPVETEISRQVVDAYSPCVQLIAFDINNDVGLFRLQDRYPDQPNFVDVNWLLERDDAYSRQLPVGCKAACCGYSTTVSEDDSRKVQDQAAHVLSKVPLAAVSFC